MEGKKRKTWYFSALDNLSLDPFAIKDVVETTGETRMESVD